MTHVIVNAEKRCTSVPNVVGTVGMDWNHPPFCQKSGSFSTSNKPINCDAIAIANISAVNNPGCSNSSIESTGESNFPRCCLPLGVAASWSHLFLSLSCALEWLSSSLFLASKTLRRLVQYGQIWEDHGFSWFIPQKQISWRQFCCPTGRWWVHAAPSLFLAVGGKPSITKKADPL